jgi:hypothetical protein
VNRIAALIDTNITTINFTNHQEAPEGDKEKPHSLLYYFFA